VEVITTAAGADSRSTAGAASLLAAPVPASDEEFAELVDALIADPNRHDQLTDLLRENHPWYNERGTATVAQMRG